MERPVNIDTKFIKTYTRRPFDDVDELVYVLTWADGSVTERYTIPNDLHQLYVECVNARHDANLKQMALEHAEGRVGATKIIGRAA